MMMYFSTEFPRSAEKFLINFFIENPNNLTIYLELLSNKWIINNNPLFSKWSNVAVEDLNSLGTEIRDNRLGIQDLISVKDKLNSPSQVVYFNNLLGRSNEVLELLEEKFEKNFNFFFQILSEPNKPDNISLMRIATSK